MAWRRTFESERASCVRGKQHKIYKVAVCVELLEEVSCAGWGSTGRIRVGQGSTKVWRIRQQIGHGYIFIKSVSHYRQFQMFRQMTK